MLSHSSHSQFSQSFAFSVITVALVAGGCTVEGVPVDSAASGLECAQYIETARAAAAGDELTLEQIDDLDIVREAFENMPEDVRAEGEALLAEAHALGIPSDELEARLDELTTVDVGTLERLSSAYVEQLGCSEYLPTNAAGDEIGASESALLPFLAAGGAVLLCGGTVAACTDDSVEQYLACADNSVCPAGQVATQACCFRKKNGDVRNCALTCGANGPDGDYADCCRPAPRGSDGASQAGI